MIDISNAIKYYKNNKRVSKLRKKGAKIGQNVFISEGCTFDNPEKLSIGNNVYIGNNFYSNCLGGLTIGNGTVISYNCTIMTYNHDYNDPLFMPYGLSNVYKEVIIEDHVWIGINVSINSGVTIGKNSIIGLGAVVPKSVPENTIYAGYRILKELENKDYKYDLLQVRAVYNPFNYLKFNRIMKKIINNKTSEIDFSTINEKYKNEDIYIMIYRWCENMKNYSSDWEKEKILYISNKVDN